MLRGAVVEGLLRRCCRAAGRPLAQHSRLAPPSSAPSPPRSYVDIERRDRSVRPDGEEEVEVTNHDKV